MIVTYCERESNKMCRHFVGKNTFSFEADDTRLLRVNLIIILESKGCFLLCIFHLYLV
jgi:hypothetical protein